MQRQEAKHRSRQRLLDAALEIVDESDVAGLTTTSITRRAGMTQSNFYVHFASIDDLLGQLVDQVWEDFRSNNHRTREAARDLPADDFLRTRFRSLVDGLITHPAVFRLVLRAQLDPSSAIGEDARAQMATSRQNLAGALAELGAAASTPSERRKLDMVAAGLIAVKDTLALSHLEGTYPDIDEIIEVLMLFYTQMQRALT